MNFRVSHRTRYVYSEPVSLCHNELRLVPRTLPHQQVAGAKITVTPMPSGLREREDFFGNRVCYFAVQQPHDELSVTVTSIVRVLDGPERGMLPPESGAWEAGREELRAPGAPDALDASQFVFDSPLVSASAELAAYALPSFPPKRPILLAAQDLMTRIFYEFNFRPGFTTVSTPLTEVLKHRSGVCQDFAHLAIGCFRSMGLAARYVSGYIETLPPPGQERLKGADVSHAWFSVFAPGLGWFDFDPTNNLIPGDRHIITAWGRDFSDVTPLKGIIFSGGTHRLSVSVDVERWEEGAERT